MKEFFAEDSASDKDEATSDVKIENKHEIKSLLCLQDTQEQLLQLRKEKFRRKVQSELVSCRSYKSSRKTKVEWDESEYDAFVKTIRSYGRDYVRLQEALQTKTEKQIRRFTRVLCTQIESMDDHPELDILEALLETSSDEEDDHLNVI